MTSSMSPFSVTIQLATSCPTSVRSGCREMMTSLKFWKALEESSCNASVLFFRSLSRSSTTLAAVSGDGLKYFLTAGRILVTMFCTRSEATSWVWRFCNRSEETGRVKGRRCVLHKFGRLLGCSCLHLSWGTSQWEVIGREIISHAVLYSVGKFSIC